MVNCTTEFDLLERGYDGWLISLGGIIAFCAILLMMRLRKMIVQKPPSPAQKISVYLALCSGLIWTAIVLPWTYFTYADLADSYRGGMYQEVSGIVEKFNHSIPTERRNDSEEFEVNGVTFSYSESGFYPGFQHVRTAGGPIREGLPVRIRYIGDVIVRLEVCS